VNKSAALHRGLRVTLAGVVINALLAGTKAIAGIAGNSYALVADAIESTFDIISSLVVLSGITIASTPPDEDHPYGHGKAEPLAAMVVAVALCTAAAGIAIQSVREIITPHHAPAPFTLAVLLAVVVIKEILFRRVFATGEATRSTALKTDAWHHRSDALTSLAAGIGISVALVGGRGYESADDIAALAASCVIAFNGLRLLRPAVREIMDAAPSPDIEENVRSLAAGVPGVMALDKCFVRKMGLEFYVDLHVVVDGSITVAGGHEIAHRVKDAVCSSTLPVANVLVHIEPHHLPLGNRAQGV
jgi:cation diffusion facilitator family transporter